MDQDLILLSYRVSPATGLVLPQHKPGRRDRLWESTCFELFSKEQRGPNYREFNFAPAFSWNAYGFHDWRLGMKPLDFSQEPHLVDSRVDDRAASFPEFLELDVILRRSDLGEGERKLSLTAVTEESDGNKFYWALKHPDLDKPDFHHPDCFTLELPPPAKP